MQITSAMLVVSKHHLFFRPLTLAFFLTSCALYIGLREVVAVLDKMGSLCFNLNINIFTESTISEACFYSKSKQCKFPKNSNRNMK